MYFIDLTDYGYYSSVTPMFCCGGITEPTGGVFWPLQMTQFDVLVGEIELAKSVRA